MRYLFIGAHCDDLELNCGATIARLSSEDNTTTMLVLSHVYSEIELRGELNKSVKCLGHDFENFVCYDFKTRAFDKSRQEILDLFIQLRQTEWDYVFTHSPNDFHQDHSVVGQESIRAFRNTNLITYTSDWNARQKTNNYFVKLEKHHIETKVDMLACYGSQKHRNYMHPDYTWANALNTGVICNSKYAEGFQAINLIV